ncbi:MAG: hypothetical protein ACRETD_15080 [Steroidobacteraceae bacterium]
MPFRVRDEYRPSPLPRVTTFRRPGQREDNIMGRRFLVLRACSLILRIIGWVLVIAGVIAFALGVAALIRTTGQVGGTHEMLAGGFGTVIAGFVFVLYGELIEVFFGIESNTRRTAELIARLSAVVPPAAPPAG